MARAKQPPAAPEPEEEFVPPFYEATQDLYIYNPEAGTMPVAAFRAGDRVPPEMVEPNGWGGSVKLPAQYEGQPAAPGPAPGPEPGAPAGQPQADTPAPDAAGAAGTE
jgi:hypothetical protein